LDVVGTGRRRGGRRRPMIYDRVAAAAVQPDGRTAGQRLLMDDRAAGGGGSGEHGRPPAAFRCLINYPLLPLAQTVRLVRPGGGGFQSRYPVIYYIVPGLGVFTYIYIYINVCV